MKIALVIFHADPARGGAERYTADLAGALQRRGHDVAVLASSFGQGSQPDRQIQLNARGLTRLGQYVYFIDALDAHLAQHSYDIVHAMLPVRACDVYHPHAGIAAEAMASGHLKYANSLKAGLARLANGVNVKRRTFAKVERELLVGAASSGTASGRVRPAGPPIVLSLSQYVQRDLLAHYDLPPSRLAILFNGTDLARFDPSTRPEAGAEVRRKLGLAPDRVVALMIAQDFQRKGLAQAIEAMARIEDPRLVLVVVGKQSPGPYRQLASQLGVADRVVFAGGTSDPFAHYQAADFFVLPTRHDPCSLVVLEALAMGVPVISTVFNGACEIMTDGMHGFVLPDPADVTALAGDMKRLLDDGARADMRSACLALRPRLSYEHHLDELERIYGMAKRSRNHDEAN